MQYKCPACNYLIDVKYPKVIHSGFSNRGFIYCDKSGDLVIWGTYDQTYVSLIPDKHPWTLNKKEQKILEKGLLDCPCGGKFKFTASPRCPNCNVEIPDILPDDIHWVELKKLIDGDKENIWKNPIPRVIKSHITRQIKK